ncbi:putative symporter YodF [Komagataeibacter europaeus]|uniref:Na+/solute symporter n=2 Tax=Komagataeibacter europaeus TaxID=33995 RepID=A0A0D6Q2S5_KOMEU|nr:sodium:solute symporter [Komagataeibacter europaeus]KON66210.1 putative symporter YodF [Komagataeibacter europaeus]GAN97270.1 Na+/solute symporter [Komagataeibacter europaeus NBRC 3261]GBQ40040.1 Na+/solute symporter [Komagataeibacter europaeus LMG 18890]
MNTSILPGNAAISVFVVCFVATIMLGSTVRLWRPLLNRRTRTNSHSEGEEWGLGGREFGAWVTWFLVGGDFYTAYTVIAVPALVYSTGGFGFFALPYTIIVYPFIFAVMPRLWTIARDGGHATAADIVRARFGSRTLELMVAVSGLVAVLPYIALQLIGIRTVIEALGFTGMLPLLIAFVSLAAYTWLGGLHAPALTAFIKDVMIYIAVLAAVIIVPIHLGGYGAMFHSAAGHLPSVPDGHIVAQGQVVPYATLALSSAFAAFLYPHTLTGILAAKSADTIRQNAVFLPAYTIVLGLIALLGLMAHAAGIVTTSSSQVVPQLFLAIFPPWFAGFCFAAIAVGALVPASVMAIGAANLIMHNILPHRSDSVTGSRVAGFAVKVGALGCVIFLNARFAIDLQLLGGVIILQTFPALIMGLLPLRLPAPALVAGWVIGSVAGLGLCWIDGLKPVHPVTFAGFSASVSTGLLALGINIAVTLMLGVVIRLALGASPSTLRPGSIRR